MNASLALLTCGQVGPCAVLKVLRGLLFYGGAMKLIELATPLRWRRHLLLLVLQKLIFYDLVQVWSDFLGVYISHMGLLGPGGLLFILLVFYLIFWLFSQSEKKYNISW